MLGFKLIHVSKGAPGVWSCCYVGKKSNAYYNNNLLDIYIYMINNFASQYFPSIRSIGFKIC